MADYNRSEAYDLSLYGMPAVKPIADEPVAQPQRKAQPARPKKSAAQIRRESIASAMHALRILVVAVTLLTLFGAILFSRISLAMLEKEAVQIADKIKDAESENSIRTEQSICRNTPLLLWQTYDIPASACECSASALRISDAVR